MSAPSIASADRRVPIGDSRNARHMGGYDAGGGRRTRADRLFRSGWFALAGDEERAALTALDIRQVVDFRTPDELERRPLAVTAGSALEIVSAPILSGNMRAYIAGTAKLKPDELDCHGAMVRLYGDILDYGRPFYATMFEALRRGEGGSLLMCSAGKDRTGVGAALLLSALGVGRDDIFADYLITADLYRGLEAEMARQHGYEKTGHDLARFVDVFTVHDAYLAAAWEAATLRAGSMSAFAIELAGGPEAVTALRDRFTAP